MNRSPLFCCLLLPSLLLIAACDKLPRPDPEALTLLQTVDLSLREPSGLSLSDNPEQLLVVSDDDNRIYRLNLDGTAQALSYGGNDLEGICQNLVDRTIWVIEEENQLLLHLDVNGNPMDTLPIDYVRTESNHGPEGVAIDPVRQRLYVLTEKQPALLLEMDYQGTILNRKVLNFAADYSGITFSPTENLLYIVSDESQLITQCNLKGEPLESYLIEVVQAEGIAVDIPNNRIYVVSDPAEQLYIYERK